MKNGKTNKKIIGFIVAGQSDYNFINYLYEDYFKDKFEIVIIPTSSNAALLSSSKGIASTLLYKGINHVFALFESEQHPPEKYIEFLSESLKEYSLENHTTIIPVDPFIESWILSAYVDEKDRKSMDMETQLDKLKTFGFEQKPFEFGHKQLDFSKMMKNKNFEDFIHKVEEKI